MLEKIIKDYFSFTRKERIAVIILVCLIIIIFLLPYWIPEPENAFSKTSFDTLRAQPDQLQTAKENQQTTVHSGYSSTSIRKSDYTFELKREEAPLSVNLFYFDPNTLSVEGWKKLGLRDKTIATIQNYISKGGKFRNREDIGKIYGLSTAETARLMPFVKIAVITTTSKSERHETAFSATRPANNPYLKKSSSVPSVVDINTADSTEWMALPGIGSRLTARILRFREKLGGFYSVDQLSEIYALPDSTFQKLRPLLAVAKTVVPFININTAQANDLKQHPYIKWNMANSIVEYRNQHGDFKSLEDLHKIDLVTDEVYSKIVPYLKVE